MLTDAADASGAFVQEVRGTVTDAETGEPLIGVNVVVQETTVDTATVVGTTTDSEGQYELALPSGDAVLVFSYIGYVAQEVPVKQREQIDVVMEVDVATMEDVVVVGYGMQQRVNLTGSVSAVSSEEIEGRPVTPRFTTS